MAAHEISSRWELREYALRRLGYPVLEINVDDDQLEDLLDDAVQYFQERHYDGIERTFLKHKLNDANKDLLRTGVTTTTASSTVGITTVSYTEANNFLKLPDHVLGVEKVFKIDSSTVSSGMFNIKYQIFLNDLYYYGALDLLNYAMTKSYLEDMNRLLTPDVQLRFNKKNHRLYLDMDWVKKQWGQNLIKFNGVLLPGGVALNGREIYEDAVRELEIIEDQLRKEYEMPPLDMIG